MDAQNTGDVAVRCICGKRFRIHNAFVGFSTQCPVCGSSVEVSETDFDTQLAADGSIRLQEETEQAQDAILIAPEPIRLAGKGSRPGMTSQIVYTNEDALLTTAMDGYVPPIQADIPPNQEILPQAAAAERRRTFVEDMLSSFWFAGNRNNALNLVLTAIPSAVLTVAAIAIPFPLNLIVLPFAGIVFAYVVQFYWLVIQTTARGEDEIPWFDSDWDMISDVFWPMLWIGFFSFVCSLPALWVVWYVPAGTATTVLAFALLAGGWFFWPVGIMSVAAGNSTLFFRPDWLVRCVAAIGPSYVVAWLLVMAIIAPWIVLLTLSLSALSLFTTPLAILLMTGAITAPPLAMLNLYCGYAMFRILGVMYRHHRDRFPWKF